jgi:outer membrane protein W
MKKTISITLGLWLMAGLVHAKGIRVEVKGSFFSSENEIFRDVYGGGVKFGFEAGMDVATNVAVFAGLGCFHKNGVLTITEEETQVSIMPLTLGVRYEIPSGDKIRFHIGAGLQEVFFKEEASLGTVKENALGLLLTGGGMYSLNKSVGIGLFLEWSTCKMKHEEVEFKVGGLELGAGVEVRF